MTNTKNLRREILEKVREYYTQFAKETNKDFEQTVAKGAYILMEEDKSRPIDITLIGTGSELHLAKEVHETLTSEKFNKNVRTISMPCMDIFEAQDKAYKDSIVPKDGLIVSIEAATSFGWERYTGRDGVNISVDTFGKSEPMEDLQQDFGFTVDLVVEQIVSSMQASAS